MSATHEPGTTDGRTVLLEALPEGFTFDAEPSTLIGNASIIAEGPSTLTIEVESESPAILTAAFAFRPGWQAFLNGEEVEVLRTYGGLLGVAVPEGRHFVVLDYSSKALPIGLLVTLFSGLALACLAWQEARTRGTGT